MKVTLYLAMSLNGIIADKKGKEDFLSEKNWDLFVKKAENVGCFIVGRKTYEIFTKSKYCNFNKINCKKIVVSKKEGFSPKEAVNLAKKSGLKEVLVVGGSEVNSSFIKSNLIDQIIVNIEPTILGSGIKLFSEADFHKKLNLKKISKFGKILQLNYEVIK